MFWSLFWPIALITIGNCFYNVCAKSTPLAADAYLSMAVAYLTGAAVSFLIYLGFGPKTPILEELSKLNWTAPVLGLSIVALEVGYIFAYRAGWKINTASLVTNTALAIILLFIGLFCYGEPITMRKFVGVVICCVGLYFLIK